MSDNFTSIEQTLDGGYIIGRYSNSNISVGLGSKTENAIGDEDYWIVKVDSLGNVLWDNTIGSTDNDYLRTIHQTFDGGYILGGNSQGNLSGDKSENRIGTSVDIWIVKLDIFGNVIWDNTIGGTNMDNVIRIIQTNDSGFIIGGSSSSNISGDKSSPPHNAGISDCWIVKTDRNGSVVWDKTIGGNDFDRLESLEQTADGGFILGGESYSNTSAEKTENGFGDNDYWIVKTDGFANVICQKTLGGSHEDLLGDVIETIDGGYIAVGRSRSNISGNKTDDNIGYYSAWIVKLTNLYCPHEYTICEAQSYFFNNQYLNTEGVYKDTLLSSGGGDSIVSLKLTILATYRDSIETAICTGQTYTHGQEVYNTTGFYSDTLISSVTGCDSIIVLNLSVDSVLKDTINDTICEGETYSFSSQNLVALGIYNDTLTSFGGCDSIVTLNLIINPISRDTTTQSICTGDSILWGSDYYKAGGYYNDTLTSSLGCDSIKMLHLMVDSVLD